MWWKLSASEMEAPACDSASWTVLSIGFLGGIMMTALETTRREDAFLQTVTLIPIIALLPYQKPLSIDLVACNDIL